MKEINLRRIELGNSGFSYTQNEKLKRLEKQLKPIEKEVRALETLHNHYNDGTLKDFIANTNSQSRQWYEKAIEKYEKSVAKSDTKHDTFTSKEPLQSVDNEIMPNTTPKRQGGNKKEIIARKIDIVDEFEEKQFDLWGEQLHKELTQLQDEIDKTLGKNLGLRSGDLSDDKIMNALASLRYGVFAKLLNKAQQANKGF